MHQREDMSLIQLYHVSGKVLEMNIHFYKTNWFLVSKQKTNFYLTVVEEPSNAVRCENDVPIVETFPHNSYKCR